VAIVLTIRDETFGVAGDDHVVKLEVPTESMTVRELIRERVYQEVDDFNRLIRAGQANAAFRGLVRPDPEERLLNGEKRKGPREISWKRSFDVAVAAYENRRMLVIVGDRETSSLDEIIQLRSGTEVTFLRLVLLAGG